jgi:hypothetical protein
VTTTGLRKEHCCDGSFDEGMGGALPLRIYFEKIGSLLCLIK